MLDNESITWVIDRVRDRMTRGASLTGLVRLADPTPAQRSAVQKLFGRKPGTGGGLTVSLDALDALLREKQLAEGLAAAVVTLRGPITPAKVAAAALDDAWQRAMAPLVEAVSRRPELEDWYNRTQTRALIRRLFNTPDAAEPELRQLASVLTAMPASGVSLTTFASRTAGNAHALDTGKPLAALAESAIRTTWLAEPPPATGRAQHRRLLWEAVGIQLDELSSTVLALNLAAAPGSYLYRFTQPALESGEPLVLTLRQLARHEAKYQPQAVYVCENPTIVAAAADELGPASPTVVCVSGQPSSAAIRLLTGLNDSAATFHYHGDFDWGGLRIANLLLARVPWTPWRFQTVDYLAAVGDATRRLRGRPTTATWDEHLAEAIASKGVSVDEELVLEDLLSDLRHVQYTAS
ncbi:TIGR02679 family protein [Catellatospora bangladeshensis]|uniref:TIGR02679 family protein n=1 Tax=Catellatospora bangladeshensis TaxID=310355 RepID=UPI001942C845|nr:TIGR02679 family protein [Catellatospora bangladeshensis]